MPEGHTVHRLARTFSEALRGGTACSEQPAGAVRAGSDADRRPRARGERGLGKQLFLGLGLGAPGQAEDLRWLRVHLGLYGAWTFSGDSSSVVVHAIGAPRKRIGERDSVPLGAPAAATPDGEWNPPEPRGAVRVRLLGEHAVADLTGPTACEVISTEEKRAVEARLGPDPIRDDADPERFVDAVRRSRTTIGQLLMNQDVLAGVGNIYRAEVLFRAGLDPLRPGRDVPAEGLRAMWEDLVVLMRDGATHGAIVTTRVEDRQAFVGAGAGLPPYGPQERPGAAEHGRQRRCGPVRRGVLRLSPRRAAVPRVRHAGPHEGPRRSQALPVPHLPALSTTHSAPRVELRVAGAVLTAREMRLVVVVGPDSPQRDASRDVCVGHGVGGGSGVGSAPATGSPHRAGARDLASLISDPASLTTAFL